MNDAHSIDARTEPDEVVLTELSHVYLRRLDDLDAEHFCHRVRDLGCVAGP